MSNIQLSAISGSMAATLHSVPAFPGDTFPIGFPEAIGDTSAPIWFGQLKAEWKPAPDGHWESAGKLDGLSYGMKVNLFEDVVDIEMTLKNESAKTWDQ